MKLLELEQYTKEIARQKFELAEQKDKKLVARRERIVTRHIRPLVVASLLEDYGTCALEADDLNAALLIQDERYGPNWGELRKHQDQGKQWFYTFSVVLSLPEHNDIHMSDNRAYFNIDEHKIEIELRTDGRKPWYVDDQHCELTDALDIAARAYQREHERMQTRADEKVRNASRAVRQAEAERLQDEERQALCDILARDPVAFRLLQAFIAIQDQRATWKEQLEAASNSMADINARYGERLSQAEQASRDAQREAQNARNAADEARDDADRVQRKLKQIEQAR